MKKNSLFEIFHSSMLNTYIFEGDKLTYKMRYKKLSHRLCGRSEGHLKIKKKHPHFFDVLKWYAAFLEKMQFKGVLYNKTQIKYSTFIRSLKKCCSANRFFSTSGQSERGNIDHLKMAFLG